MTQTDSMNEEEEKRPRFTVGSGYVSNHQYVKEYLNDHIMQQRQCETSLQLLDALGVEDEKMTAYMASQFAFKKITPSAEIRQMFQKTPRPDVPLDKYSPEVRHLERTLKTDLNCVSLQPKVGLGGTTTWLVTLKVMDMQMTTFENAALSVFVAMLANILTQFDVDFTIPIS